MICCVFCVTWICGCWEAQLHCALFLLYLLFCTERVPQTIIIPQFLLHKAVVGWPVSLAFSHPYIHTHPTTLMPVTLCSPTLISNKHWSRNLGLTLFRACWLWAPPCETWRGILYAVRSHHLSCSGGPQKWTACDIKPWFILVGILF